VQLAYRLPGTLLGDVAPDAMHAGDLAAFIDFRDVQKFQAVQRLQEANRQDAISSPQLCRVNGLRWTRRLSLESAGRRKTGLDSGRAMRLWDRGSILSPQAYATAAVAILHLQ